MFSCPPEWSPHWSILLVFQWSPFCFSISQKTSYILHLFSRQIVPCTPHEFTEAQGAVNIFVGTLTGTHNTQPTELPNWQR